VGWLTVDTAGVSAYRISMATSGFVGIGPNNTAPSRQLHVLAADAGTVTTTFALRLSHTTSGTAGTTFGTGVEFELENASGTNRIASTVESIYTDAVNATEDAKLVWSTITAGTLTVQMTLDSTGILAVPAAKILSGTGIPAGGTAGSGYKFSSATNFGMFFGSGVPSLAAAKGSLYLRSDGSTTNDRAYINTDGTTAWTALTTAA